VAEERPFKKGERVYVLYPEGSQEPGTTCPTLYVIEDDGRDERVLLTSGEWTRVERIRRDRRGRKLPAYNEVARG
jgi:hypothetical protein